MIDVIQDASLFLIIVYLFIFFVTYVQLWLIYCCGHKRGSFQSMFLYLCLFWSGLRATLFSFYIGYSYWSNKTFKHLLPLWILFSFPICLQFFIVCLLNLFFLQVAYRVKPQYAADPRKYLLPLRVASALVVLIFLAVNVSTSSTILIRASAKNCTCEAIQTPITIRVCVNNLLFVLCAISLAWSLIKIARSPSASILLPFKGTTVCRSLFVGITIVLLYLSRLIGNLIAIDCKKQEISDEIMDLYIILDQTGLSVFQDPSGSYIVYAIIVFIWEILPTSVTLLIFKIDCPRRCKDSRNHQDDLVRSGRFHDMQSDSSDDEMDYPASCSNAILP